MKIDVFNYPTVVWRPLSREPLRISAQTLCRQRLESMAYIFALIVWVYLHSIFCGGLRNTHLLCNRMRIGRSRSSKVLDFGTNRKGVCDFLLVINSNFGPILHRFWEMASYWLKIANFSYPSLFDAPVQGEPVRISGWNLARKNQRDGENCTILTSTVFDWSTRVTDRQADGRTDGIAIAYVRLQHMLSRATNTHITQGERFVDVDALTLE